MKKGTRRRVSKARNKAKRKPAHKRGPAKKGGRIGVIPYSALFEGRQQSALDLFDVVFGFLSAVASDTKTVTVTPESRRVNPPGTIDLVKNPDGTYK